MTPTTPDRLAGHQDLLAGARRGEDLTGLAVALGAVVAQDLRGPADLADTFGPGLAALLGGELDAPRLGVGVDHVGGRRQHRAALVDRRPRQPGRRVACGSNAGVDIGRAGESSLGHHDVRTRRVQAAQRVAGAVAPLPASNWRIATVMTGTPRAR